MSKYEYRCVRCGCLFEKVMALSEHLKQANPPCPKCHGSKTEQLPSSFQAVTAKKT